MALKSNTWIYMRLDLWTILFGPGHYKGPEQFLKYILTIKQWREREREREREVVYTTWLHLFHSNTDSIHRVWEHNNQFGSVFQFSFIMIFILSANHNTLTINIPTIPASADIITI